MTTSSYSIPDVLNRALPVTRQEAMTYTTPRSGVPVSVSDGGRVLNKPVAYIEMDSMVDEHDARQLAEFFTALAARLAIR